MEKTEKIVSPYELQKLCSSFVNGRFATFEAITVPKLRKGGPDVVKVASAKVQWNVNYGNAVNAKRERNGEEAREIQPRKWGVRLSGKYDCFSFHIPKGQTRGKLYVRMDIISSLGYVYLDRKTGAEVDKDLVHSYMSKPADTEIIWREYGIGTITKITADGITYVVSHDIGLTGTDLEDAKKALDKANTDRQAARDAKKKLATVS